MTRLKIRRRVCHHVVEIQSLVQSVGKAGIVGLAKIMFTDTIPAAAF